MTTDTPLDRVLSLAAGPLYQEARAELEWLRQSRAALGDQTLKAIDEIRAMVTQAHLDLRAERDELYARAAALLRLCQPPFDVSFCDARDELAAFVAGMVPPATRKEGAP